MKTESIDYRSIRPEPEYYSREELIRRLRSTNITDEFREKIILALEDGTEEAIRSLGEKFTF